MNKLLIIILGFIFVSGLVFVGYSLSTDSKSKDSELSKGEDKEESFFGSMRDLLTRGKSVKCTYKNTSGEDGEVIGTLYVAGSKIRSETDVIEKKTGKKLEIDSIITEDWMYTWNNFMSGGTKINIEEIQGEKIDENYSQGEADKMKEKMDYKCRPWIVDNSKFVVPADVEFKDTTEIMKGFQERTQGIDMDEAEKSGKDAQQKLCDMCEMLTGEARDKCRVDAGCE